MRARSAAQVVPERRQRPARLAHALEVVVEPRVREVHRDHLLAAPFQRRRPQAPGTHEPPSVRKNAARAHAAHAGLLRRRRAPVVVDAQVEVPRAGVDREVAVQHRELRRPVKRIS
jgi:hypothetical protein